MTLALVVVASRCTSLLLASPRCRWLVGHPRSVRGKYTRRTPINNLKCARNDLEYGRCVTDELAVCLDADRLLAVNLDPAGPAEFNLGQPAMRSSVQHRETADAKRPTDVTDGDDIEASIIEFSLGRNPHPTAEVGPIGDGHRADAAAEDRPIVQTKLDQRVSMRQQADRRAPEKVERPTDERGPMRGPPDDLCADAGVGHVDEIAAAGRGAHAPDIDAAPAIGPKPRRHILSSARTRQAASQVGTGAALQESDSRRAAGRTSKEPVHNLVGRAVTTHRDYQAIAGIGGVVGGIASTLRLDHLEGNPGTGVRAAPPEASGPTATGGRVDDDEWRLLLDHVRSPAGTLPRMRLAAATSRDICCCRAGTEANRFSARSRCTNHTVRSLS